MRPHGSEGAELSILCDVIFTREVAEEAFIGAPREISMRYGPGSCHSRGDLVETDELLLPSVPAGVPSRVQELQ